MRIFTTVVVVLLALGAPATGQVELSSPACRAVVGGDRADADNALEFCRRNLTPETATSVFAQEMIMWVNVTEAMARAMRSDKLGSEALVLLWMRHWRQIQGSSAIVINVEWRDVVVAKGDTTWLGDDRVVIGG